MDVPGEDTGREVSPADEDMAAGDMTALAIQQYIAPQVKLSMAPMLEHVQRLNARLVQSQLPALQSLQNQNTQLAKSLQPILASARMQIPTVTIPKIAFQNLPSPTLYTLAKIPELRLPAVSTDAVTRAAVAAIRAAAPTLRWVTQEVEAEETQEPEGDVGSVLQQRNAYLRQLLDTGEFPVDSQSMVKGAPQALPGDPVDES